MNHPTPSQSPAALRGRALALLARREYSRHELLSKLVESGAAPADVEQLLAEFSERGWQDDPRFAAAFVREEIRKGHGPVSVRQGLKQRGIADELIAESLATYDWAAMAREVRERKFGQDFPSERKETARQMRFLQYRGFTGDQCRQALDNRPTE